jgi:hypothetical protein
VPPDAPLAIPRVRTQPFGDLLVATPEPLLRAHRTEVLSEAGSAVAATTTPHRNGASAGNDGRALLLRADETLGDMATLNIDEITRPPTARLRPRAFDNRSAIAREIDRELSQAERRLFPNDSSSAVPFGQIDDYDDALSDIDLDSLAIDTIPGLAQSLGMDEPRARGRREVPPPPPPVVALADAPPLRPVQEEGELAETDVAELIARLHGHAFSGALHVRLPDGEKVLYLEQGEPVGASSTMRHDQLAELLYREGKLGREQAQRARGPAGEASARAVALALVEQGALKEREVFGVMRRHAEEVLYSLCALERGAFELRPTLPSAEDRVRLSAPLWALLLEGVRRKYGLERLGAHLGGRELVLRPTTSFSRVVEAAGLTADERRVVALLDGVRTLGEVRAAIGGRVPESVVFALAWLLVVSGAADSGGAGATDVRYASTVVTADDVGERRAQRRLDGPEQVAAEEAVERERIASKRAQIADADYFAILGVARDASEHELRRAHERLRADFDAVRFSAAAAEEHREALDEIRDVLDEAARVLLHPGVRQRYAANLPAATED